MTLHSLCAEEQWGELRTWGRHTERLLLVLNSEYFHRQNSIY